MTCMHDYEIMLPLLACPLNILQKVDYEIMLLLLACPLNILQKVDHDSINCPKIFLMAQNFHA